MTTITLDRISKSYGGRDPVVRDVSLEIADGELMILVGPSGCGKSTVLRMIVGLEDITAGDLYIGGQRVNDRPPRDRNLAMVFQNYALYPHLTVFENIAFPLRLRKTSDDEVRRRVEQAAEMLELTELLSRKPGQLSGGQRQRVAMGRALVREAEAFLFDEPLSNLDAKLRGQMRTEISRLQHQLGMTTVYVTHDQVEAMTLGDRVAVMRDGVLQQVDRPQGLYDRPANLFVAEFIGSPAMNLVGADVVQSNGQMSVEFGENRLLLDDQTLADRPALRRFEGRRIIVGIRPDDLEDASLVPGAPEDRRLSAVVDIREDMGSEVFVHFGVAAPPVRGEDVAAAVGAEAIEATAAQAREKGSLFVARLSRETRVREDERLELLVDTRRLHFFDTETGNGIYDEAPAP
jgi:multiple sugar transport system ATP-binding protein